MSKLDDIFDNFTDNPYVKAGHWTLGKQQVKDLMLELIGYGSVDMEYDLEKLSLSEKAELVGLNKLTSELRKKVEAL